MSLFVRLKSHLLLCPPERERGAWSLVCDTEQQWASLAESIKDKTSPQDRHLYRIISQNFLPEISSMIQHKVTLPSFLPDWLWLSDWLVDWLWMSD